MKAAKFTGADYSYKTLDDLSFPDYEPFGIQELMDSYSMATRLLYRYSRPYPRPFPIVTARGCSYACTFCIDHHRGYRARSIANIMEEIKVTYEKYHYNILLIDDELFVANRQRMMEFCAGLLVGREEYGWDFDWMFQTHANARLDLETLTLAKETGCYMFSYGLESASPRVLESMDKHLKVENVIEAIKLAREVGVGFSANLIFGDTAETHETVAESLEFWLKYGKEVFLFLAHIMPYPGSALFNHHYKTTTLEDKKQYYEKIDEGIPNLTSISNKVFPQFLNLFQFLEKNWLFVKMTPSIKWERDNGEDKLIMQQGGFYYKIWVKCPYCEEEILYRERLIDPKQAGFLGTGCPKCGRKIKVEVV